MEPLIDSQFHNTAVLAEEFHRHSSTEAIGARTIRHVAEMRASGDLKERMLAHATDETRHSKMFLALAEHYTNSNTPSFHKIIQDNNDFIENFEGSLDWFLCDTHIAELRNLAILGMYVKGAKRHAPAQTWATKTLEKIFDDEWRHVSYTAPYVAATIGKSSENFDEFSNTAKHYGQHSLIDTQRLYKSLHER
jgi:hypothetical protein